MKVDIKLEGMERVKKRLAEAKKSATSPVVEVGYTANYAIYVHEMVGANFQSPKAEAKFLEKSLRRVKPQVANLVQQFLGRGASFGQSLYMVGLNVQRTSQKITPIDTGNLKGSAFTRFGKRG